MRIAVPQYPGLHGVDDVIHAYTQVLGAEAYPVWHEEESLDKPDAVVLAGGYSFGDYLRPGGLAKASRLSGQIRRFAKDGGPVLGIGNGFQILCELDLLPGALRPNWSGEFVNENVYLKVDSTQCPFMASLNSGDIIRLPVAHSQGAYWADPRTIRELEETEKIALRYANEYGDVDEATGYNGSINAIAAVISRHGNVLGMMAHPERAVEELLGSTAGRPLLASILDPDPQ